MSTPDPAAISILIVEDNLLLRTGVSKLLGGTPPLSVVGRAVDGAEGLALFRSLRPDVVVTDLRMPGVDGVALIESLIAEDAGARVLVLTHYDGEENIFRAIRAGALGYVTKDAGSDVLIQAVKTVARGERFLPAEIAAKYAARTVGKGLSRREQQVLELLQGGLINREIAERLGLRESTIHVYMAALMDKLGARNRTEIVTHAYQRGLLQPAKAG